jgi:hypothetical protein
MSAQWRDVEQRYSHGHHGDSSHQASNHNNDDDDFDDDGDSGYDTSRLLDGASGGGSEDALLARIRQLQLARHDIDHRMRSLDGYASAGRNSVATFPSLPPALPPITSQQHNAGRASYWKVNKKKHSASGTTYFVVFCAAVWTEQTIATLGLSYTYAEYQPAVMLCA